MYAENGTWNFAAETTRDRVQTGSTHRHHLQKIGPDAARKMHRDTTRELIERARRDSELVDGVFVSIDITKSNPYRTKRKVESAEFYFQWASIQIVGVNNLGRGVEQIEDLRKPKTAGFRKGGELALLFV